MLLFWIRQTHNADQTAGDAKVNHGTEGVRGNGAGAGASEKYIIKIAEDCTAQKKKRKKQPGFHKIPPCNFSQAYHEKTDFSVTKLQKGHPKHGV